MCRRPIDVLALSTERKFLLRGENVGRHLSLDSLFGDGLKKPIALHAASERFPAYVQIESLNDLLELIAKMVASNQ